MENIVRIARQWGGGVGDHWLILVRGRYIDRRRSGKRRREKGGRDARSSRTVHGMDYQNVVQEEGR